MAGSFPKKNSAPSKARTPAPKRNTSLLSFFQKTDTPHGATTRQSRMTQFVTSSRSPSSGRGTPTSQRGNGLGNDSGGLFLEDRKGLASIEKATAKNVRPRSQSPDDIWGEADDVLGPDDSRYNENDSAAKRRKVDSSSPSAEKAQSKSTSKPDKAPKPTKKNNGPFIDESDSEDDMEAYRDLETIPDNNETLPALKTIDDPPQDPPAERVQSPSVRDATRYAENDEFADFDDLEEEELAGEEFREEPWGDEEQGETIGLGLDAADDLNDFNDYDAPTNESVNSCPICQKSLAGYGETVSRIFLLILRQYADVEVGTLGTCK